MTDSHCVPGTELEVVANDINGKDPCPHRSGLIIRDIHNEVREYIKSGVMKVVVGPVEGVN